MPIRIRACDTFDAPRSLNYKTHLACGPAGIVGLSPGQHCHRREQRYQENAAMNYCSVYSQRFPKAVLLPYCFLAGKRASRRLACSVYGTKSGCVRSVGELTERARGKNRFRQWTTRVQQSARHQRCHSSEPATDRRDQKPPQQNNSSRIESRKPIAECRQIAIRGNDDVKRH
jgi:hypothetical protein